jgi:hypothetical protein
VPGENGALIGVTLANRARDGVATRAPPRRCASDRLVRHLPS